MGAAVDFFSLFGELARVDLSREISTGSVTVTFFDVRSAQQLLDEFPDLAVPAAPGSDDVTKVAIPSSIFVSLPAFNGFERFGEIARVGISDGDVVVTFNDMRAARKAMQTLEGCVACPLLHSWQGVSSQKGQPQSQMQGVAQALPQTQGQQNTLSSLQEQCKRSQLLQAQQVQPQPSLQALAQPQQTQPQQPQPQQPQQYQKKSESPSMGQSRKFLEQNLSSKKTAPQAEVSPSSKPVETRRTAERAKAEKELSKYDIMPEHIRNGQDTRTAVMVRNIPKACSRDSFAGLLTYCGLHDRYTFLYTPFDKRRNIHCGFSFVNFMSPQDVLVLYDSMQTQLWRSLPGNTGANKPAVSYARIQGHEKLVKHFRPSDVMHDQDVLKRPIFRSGGVSDESQEFDSEGVSCSTSSRSGSAKGRPPALDLPTSMQPLYVQVTAPTLAKKIDYSMSVDLLSTAFGG
eukprot:CAMPEP_0170595978 /NCGR_PEP_ID=MMETSP0224-20130122/14857_1 /TAXON_ID=285029 /ORGANISM="Togula jolla, Strain CCCM 725" /LENGTH=458 /DNA_ID=CAMNT_0010920209 /DNA_START=100 /DNA_END=1476 /DNA_ORIENTATION=+